MAGVDFRSHRQPGVFVMRRHKTLGLVVVALSGGCGTEPPVPASIAVSPHSTTLLWFDETVQLTASVQDLDGRNISDVAVTWMSGDESVVTVDATGLVTAVGKGVAPVRVAAEGLEVSSTVTVDLQRGALVRIYEACGGTGWDDIRNWGTDEPIDSWSGVTTDSAGNVVVLSLRANRLTGRIPDELLVLEHLEVLYLGGNELTGPIPPELGDLIGLETLDLSGNTLTGPIPPELGDLTRIETLDLSGSTLTGPIPPALGNLAELKYLDLSYNDLTGPVPPEIANLDSLWTLYLHDNELTGPIPPELGDLRRLGSLQLSGNTLTGPIPPQLGNLAALKYLDLSHNDLTGPVPPEIGNLDGLWTMYLRGNELTGPVPPEFGSLAALQRLSIDNNLLSGRLPRELMALGLSRFYWYETDLCSPPDAEFQEWLGSIRGRRGNGKCDS